MMEMGGNAILTISRDRKMTQHAYFKIPSAQSAQENCVSHNGGLIPVPGRDLMVQGWYQGGIDVSDFTDPDHPYEVAYFDRGPIDPPPSSDSTVAQAGAAGGGRRGTIGGSWGAYYWNGYIYSSELARGFDILRAHAERQAVRQRDRGGQARAVHGVQPAEPAEVCLAGRVPRRSLVPRPARARQRSLVRAYDGDRQGTRRRREGRAARRAAHR